MGPPCPSNHRTRRGRKRMRDDGLRLAIDAAGSIGALARGLGISQPSVSSWSRVPAERVRAVEALTHVGREQLRPDLYAPAGFDRGATRVTNASTEQAGPDEV